MMAFAESSEAMPEARRLHPLTLVVRLLMSLPALGVLWLPVLWGRGVDRSALATLILYGVIAWPLILAHYLRFRYSLTPRELILESGLFTYRRRNIPLERIQNVQIERTLLARCLGLARVRVETAGSSETEGELAFVSLAEAMRLEAQLRAFREALPAPVTKAQVVEPLFALSPARLLCSGAFRFSLVFLAGLFSAMEYLNLGPEELADWLTRGRLRWVRDAFAHAPLLATLTTLLTAALLGWIAGIVVHATRFYGFRLWREDDRLYRQSGLFTVAAGVIPLRRVQALVVQTNPLMAYFGWFALEARLMGLAQEQQGNQLLVPLGRLHEVQAIATQVWPLTLPETWKLVSPRHRRRLTIRYLLFGALGIGVLDLFWTPQLWMGIGWGMGSLLWAWWQYSGHGYAYDAHFLFIRRGVLRRRVWCVPYAKVQTLSLRQSLFQRRLGLASLVVDVAGASLWGGPVLRDLPVEEAHALLEMLQARFRESWQAPQGTSERSHPV
jgi:putative membrane protein